jgi:hypothetical protein
MGKLTHSKGQKKYVFFERIGLFWIDFFFLQYFFFVWGGIAFSKKKIFENASQNTFFLKKSKYFQISSMTDRPFSNFQTKTFQIKKCEDV